MKKEISVRLLRRLINYDRQTGEMRWKPRPVWMFAHGKHGRETLAKVWNDRYAGQLTMHSPDGHGYLRGHIFKRSYGKHRLVFAFHHGRWPAGDIDHINGNPSDNRIENLRDVSQSENHKNRAVQRNNKSGCTGVRWHKACGHWEALMKVDRQWKFLGSFKNKEDAIACRKAAEKRYGFHENHGRERSACTTP